jgi:hypothetical protein
MARTSERMSIQQAVMMSSARTILVLRRWLGD